MTRVLAFDGSTRWGGVALVEQEGDESPSVVAEAGLLGRGPHAPHLLSLAEALLEEAGWARDALNAYASTRGPGSFTGLRVALGTVLGLSLSAGRPAYGIGTLQAMAEAEGPATGPRVPLLDAGRGEVYGAVYDPRGTPPREVVPPFLGPPEMALEAAGTTGVLFGTGAVLHARRLLEAGFAGLLRDGPRGVAGAAGRLALDRVRVGGAGDESSEGMSPLYLRPASAETRG